MNSPPEPAIDSQWIRKVRGPRNQVDPSRPYHTLIERERTPAGSIEEVLTVFLTGRECRFTCLMCDLWKNTTEHALPPGVIPEQIRRALAALPGAKNIKLYNSASFFDNRAIPPADYPSIAELVEPFETVIVENHPLLTGEDCLQFSRMIKPALQVAMGLETIHPGVLRSLNKKMTPGDFSRAVAFLKGLDIQSRAFILLKPPFMSEKEGIIWTKRSIDFAFECGVDIVTVIPTRAGNGAMERLQRTGHFSPPALDSLEEVLEYGISLKAGPVFADTWDLERFSSCGRCFAERKERIERMNLDQQFVRKVQCNCEKTGFGS